MQVVLEIKVAPEEEEDKVKKVKLVLPVQVEVLVLVEAKDHKVQKVQKVQQEQQDQQDLLVVENLKSCILLLHITAVLYIGLPVDVP
jgi:fucose permease